MKNFDVCIIGAGASGLMCACNINNKSVALIDKKEKIGKKILATGNGRCNLTNINLDISKYNTPLVKSYFKRFSNKDTLDYFYRLGLETVSDEEGRVYPLSNTANSVLDVLRLKIEQNKNVTQFCNAEVLSVSKEENFIIKLSDNQVICSKKLVIALGGNANLNIFNDLKLPKISYKPSLCGLKTSINKGLNNVRINNTLVTMKNDLVNFKQKGEVLFKEDSISGIVIFNLSSHLARINKYNFELSLDFLPDVTLENLTQKLLDRKQKLFDYTCENFLTGFFHKALNLHLLEKIKCQLNKKVSDISISQVKQLALLIKNFKVTCFEPLNNNQVFSGGINLKALDENFMFKSIPNLYAIGEFLDVDGECGGYNLQWSWTSGYLCAKNL